MFRPVVLLVLAAFTAQASGFAVEVEAVCTESCPDDDANGQCSPSCACTSCDHHSSRVTLEPGGVSLPLPPSADRAAERPAQCPASPEPAEILHVPKQLLA